jgi:hypothetical protein
MNTHTHTHTPGPWTATGHDGKQCVIIECTWGSVAKVLPVGAQDQETANAQLIAAAPDLLAALILAVPLMQRYAMRSPVLEPSVDRILPAMISAIAQAEGVK